MIKYEIRENIKPCKCSKCGFTIITDLHILNNHFFCLRCLSDTLYEIFFYNNVINCIDYLSWKYPNKNIKDYSVFELNYFIANQKTEDLIKWLKEEKILEIGQGLSEFTPVELVGYEDDETGSPLALDNGQFTEEGILKINKQF